MQARIGIDDLHLIHAIGATGSLSAAARQLGLHHSSAFRRLGALEARLGVRLFERSHDGYAPTPAGEAALATARRFIDELAALETRLAGEDARAAGVVRVTTTDTLVEFLAPMLATFRAGQPETTVELLVANAFFSLSKRDADVAIRPVLEAPGHLVGRRIAAVATAIYGAPGYLERWPRGAPLETFEWAAPDESLAHLASAEWVDRNVPVHRVVFRSSSLMGLLAAARAGQGVAPLPCYLADGDRRLRRVTPPVPQMASALWVLTHPHLRRAARVRAFIDFAAHWIAGRKDVLEGRGRARAGVDRRANKE